MKQTEQVVCNDPDSSRSVTANQQKQLVKSKEWNRVKYQFECQFCGIIFASKVLLKEHIFFKHIEGYRCMLCKKGFDSGTELTYHNKLHHNKIPESSVKQT